MKTGLFKSMGKIAGLAIVACLPMTAQAQDAKVTTVLSNLLNPSGVAVQPGTGQLYVADSGALRVLQVDPKDPSKHRSAIKGFSKDIYGKGPMYDIGPLGLVFTDKNTLVVGDGGKVDGSELAYIYSVESGNPLEASEAKHTLGPIAPGAESAKGEGNFYALATDGKSVFITSNGDDTKGWILKFDLKGGKPGKLTPFIATKVATNVDAPVGITMNKAGQIVVGQMGEISVPGDSLLTIYDAESGKLVANGTTGLSDIAGLAYSPKTGKLYAVDYAWLDSSKGGLFRLDVTQEGKELKVKTELVAKLDKPTALAFAEDGTLYITQIGTGKGGADERPGSLVKIDSGL